MNCNESVSRRCNRYAAKHLSGNSSSLPSTSMESSTSMCVTPPPSPEELDAADAAVGIVRIEDQTGRLGAGNSERDEDRHVLGNAIATVASQDAVKVLTVRPTAFDKAAPRKGCAAWRRARVNIASSQIGLLCSAISESGLACSCLA